MLVDTEWASGLGAMKVVAMMVVAMMVVAMIALVSGGRDGELSPKNSEDSIGGISTMRFQLTSSAFRQDEPIPPKYSGEGDDVSPPLAWEGAPDATEEFALICDDPDAPTAEPWVHWVIYGISLNAQSLAEGVPAGEAELKKPVAARQGKNSWTSGTTIGYRGPLPPPSHGTHHYHFKLYSLARKLKLPPSLTKGELLTAIKGHVLAEAELVGTYSR
jgi:Raf kinase inhibitor-like YbhB/YbcL family protein